MKETPKEEKSLQKQNKIRKRKPKTRNTYFTEETQEAILEYTSSNDQFFRNQIYKDKIEYAFFKLTQNIIHTFKFYYTDGESVEDLQQEVISFLLEKLKLYNPSKGKAYSYFGTIAKRYLIIKNKKNYQKLQDKEDLQVVDEDKKILEDIMVDHFKEEIDLEKFFKIYVSHIEKNLEAYFTEEKDKKIAESILRLFETCGLLTVFNKKTFYFYIREMIEVETSQITKVVAKMKKIYKEQFCIYSKKEE